MNTFSIPYVLTQESTTRCPTSTKDGGLTAGSIKGIWGRDYSRLLILLRSSKVSDQIGRIPLFRKHIGTKNEP